MRVHRNSLHYRLWKLGRAPYSEPRDLCRYFWHLALIKIMFPLLGVALILTGIGAILYVIFRYPVETGLIVAAGVLLAAAVIGLILFIQWRMAKRATRESKPRAPRKPKEPSVTWEFIKAKKRKACPLIEVVDDGSS